MRGAASGYATAVLWWPLLAVVELLLQGQASSVRAVLQPDVPAPSTAQEEATVMQQQAAPQVSAQTRGPRSTRIGTVSWEMRGEVSLGRGFLSALCFWPYTV